MPTYNIYFQNNYGETQTYAFFSELPKVASNVGDPKVFTNVWISKRLSGSGGNVTIKTTNDFYACKFSYIFKGRFTLKIS
jgi:hypothetical protein